MYDDRFTDGYLVGASNGYNNNGFFGGGWEGIIGLIVVAGLFGGNWGGGMFGNRGGTPATQADVRDAVDHQTLISKIDQQTYGIADSFNSLNNTIVNGFNGVNNAICTLGYNEAQLVNGLSRELADCCCSTKGAIADLKYANEKQTCDIINAINMGNQKLVDIYTNDKIETLNRQLATAEAQLSNNAQSRYIIDTVLDKLSPCPKPAFLTCNPNAPYPYPYGFNNGCGCASVQ